MRYLDIRALELQHRLLERQIHELERRGDHMTPPERERAHELKKLRLVTKDRLQGLR